MTVPDGAPIAETRFHRWTWLIWGISGLMVIGGGLLLLNSPAPAWWAWIMTALGVGNLGLAASEFRVHRQRLARDAEEVKQ